MPAPDRVLRRYLAASDSDAIEAFEAVVEYCNHNKRMPPAVLAYLKACLDHRTGPDWVVPAIGVVYRGDVNDISKITDDLGETLAQPQGTKRVALRLRPGSSWSTDLEQAQNHATSGSLNPQVESLNTAATHSGAWLDLREAYKTPRLRGLRLEREVICLEPTVQCSASWRLP